MYEVCVFCLDIVLITCVTCDLMYCIEREIIFICYLCRFLCSIGTYNCPTSGGVTLTLSGQYFGEPMEVDISGQPCDHVVVSPSSDSLTCTLPPGTGRLGVIKAIQLYIYIYIYLPHRLALIALIALIAVIAVIGLFHIHWILR